jgi:type I restriction enzyme S subunit
MSFGRPFITLIDGYIHDGWLRVRNDSSLIDREYLYYFLSSDLAQNQFKAVATGSVVNNLKSETVKAVVIDLPPLETQHTIADTLSALDDKIVNNTAVNHHLQQMAQTIFKSWFVDFEPWGGERPTDWREVELGDVASLNAGGDKPALCSPTLTNECSIPVFSNGIDNFGLYGYTDFPKVTEESVTVSARGTIGFVCLRQDPFVPIVRLVTAIPNRELITAKFLYLYLSSIHIAGVGTTQQQLTVPDFRKYRILLPSFNIVNDFTETVDPMFDTIRHKRGENARLVEIRDALLPRLMSGELSVTDLSVK